MKSAKSHAADKKKADPRVGRRIKEFRDAKGLNQAELAELIGRTNSYVSQVENAGIELSVGMLAKIALALDVAPDEIVKDLGLPLGESVESPSIPIHFSLPGNLSAKDRSRIEKLFRAVSTATTEDREMIYNLARRILREE
jgi:transcriptional regulator with XRE-family HTH domain